MYQQLRTILVKAKERISDPERWCQGYYALDSQGKTVSSEDLDATRWCAVGAVLRTAVELDPDEGYRLADEATTLLGVILPGTDVSINRVIRFNDANEHQDVLKLFDDAISLLPEE
jgi:hypothetical protein